MNVGGKKEDGREKKTITCRKEEYFLAKDNSDVNFAREKRDNRRKGVEENRKYFFLQGGKNFFRLAG